MKEAMFWKGMPGKEVQCFLCPRKCVIPNQERGFCSVRENQAGRLQSLVYGRMFSMAVDPIEKKPLHHFAPGSSCLSFCTVGCNLDCSFCQNWQISHPYPEGRKPAGSVPGEDVPPEMIVETAIKQGAEGIAYTYTEPTVFFEYALETMKLARKAGLYNVWVSNGYTSPEPAMQASRYMDAVNIDLKGSGDFYRKLCGVPSEAASRRSANLYRDQGVWVETTTLVIPGYNDSEKVLRGIARWVARNLGKDTPAHFSLFHPHFRLRDVKTTPLETLEKAVSIAREEGLRYVYIGNVSGHREESTACPECGAVLIERRGRLVSGVKDSCKCGHKLPLSGKRWIKLK